MGKVIDRNFVKSVLAGGGQIKPLLVKAADSGGLGLCNPSVFIDRGEIWMILRNVNYTLYHCENEQTFNNRWGCLSYLNPENDLHLRTWNFLCKLTPDLYIERYWKIDTSALDKEPLWQFVGLEDARLVRWDDKLYAIGVRRDTTPNGQGRMELSELEFTGDSVKEIGRYRIEHPTNPDWYCEKNWMPVLDMPYHFLKWTNPAELVKADLSTLQSTRAIEVDESNKVENIPFLRGGSQVIRWQDYYVCIVHDCDLYKNRGGQKDATYMHRFVVYDLNWKIIKIGEPFSFMDGEIEFCCGLAEFEGDFLVTFGFQDNCAFILRVPSSMIPDILGVTHKWTFTKYPTLEVTTAIPRDGCPTHCAFCPQDKLVNAYSGDRVLTYSDFKSLIDKVPSEVQITFAGFCEPFINKACGDMIAYADSKGHKIAVFTTGVGIRHGDLEILQRVPFTGVQGGFVLHLPDIEGYSILNGQMDILGRISRMKIANFQAVTMGTLPDDLKKLFPNTIRQRMFSRAGNVDRKDVIKSTYTPNATCNCQEKLYHNVLLPNGDIALCCMDYGLKHILGNLHRQTYNEIIPRPRTVFELCSYCENGVSV